MLRSFCVTALGFALTSAAIGVASAAAPPTFARSLVGASATRFALGRDAGVDVRAGKYVRISASGSIELAPGGCSRSVGPAGCSGRSLPLSVTASTGTLMAAFTAGGHVVGGWTPIGTYAVLPVPSSADRLVLRVNGLSGREIGAYSVVSDVVPRLAPGAVGPASSARGSLMVASAGTRALGVTDGSSRLAAMSTPMSGNRHQGGGAGGAGTVPVAGTYQRSDIQYLLRRFGFSDTPENVTAIQASGVSAWLTAQLSPPPPVNQTTGAMESSVVGYVEPVPTILASPPANTNYAQETEDRLIQWQVATKWQLREKVTLHWLEHFSISNGTNTGAAGINDAGAMEHYSMTVRADALGNFGQLVSDISKEPAMLYWLSNNGNNGRNPNNPPNQNFARELMQLYTIGINQLNPDGSIVQSNGAPVPAYTQTDVANLSLALTGFQATLPTQIGSYPGYLDTVTFNPGNHATSWGPVIGQTIADGTNCGWNSSLWYGGATGGYYSPAGTACVLDNAVRILVNQPTTWAYEAKEMIQRFADENPSPAFVQRISTVWGANVNSPTQIAQVVQAIATDPEFLQSKYTVVKEPIELEVDAIRALRGANSTPLTVNSDPFSNAVGDTGNMAQEIWDPPTVFSFYYPGDKEMLMNNSELLARWSAATSIASKVSTAATPPNGVNYDINLSGFAGTKNTQGLANYLLDALVDGAAEHPELAALVNNYLANNPSQANIQGAVWIILSSPEYEVN